MGRKSTKENKNPYQMSREKMELTRDMAAEKLKFVSASRIERIESGKAKPHAEEVLAMSQCYKTPSLCNYFCSHVCPIGLEHVPAVQEKALSQITLEILAILNRLANRKDRLVEITADGKIGEAELADFLEIQKSFEKMSAVIDSLTLWLNNTMASEDLLETEEEELNM